MTVRPTNACTDEIVTAIFQKIDFKEMLQVNLLRVQSQ
jgi:hypothetical protein